MKIGYARVSTKAQGESLEAQEAALKEEGCQKVFSHYQRCKILQAWSGGCLGLYARR